MEARREGGFSSTSVQDLVAGEKPRRVHGSRGSRSISERDGTSTTTFVMGIFPKNSLL